MPSLPDIAHSKAEQVLPVLASVVAEYETMYVFPKNSTGHLFVSPAGRSEGAELLYRVGRSGSFRREARIYPF